MSKEHNRHVSYKKLTVDVLTYILLILVAVLCAGPFLWLLFSSLRVGANIYSLDFKLSDFSIENFTGVFSYMNIPKYLINTVIITAASIAIDVVFSAMCAYPLAMMEFKGKNLIFGILVATMIIPAAAGMIVNYLIISKMHLLNTFTGVVLPTSVKAFSIILMRQAYLGVPKDLVEAARIDGASEMRIWAQIMVPGIMPSISRSYISCASN